MFETFVYFCLLTDLYSIFAASCSLTLTKYFLEKKTRKLKDVLFLFINFQKSKYYNHGLFPFLISILVLVFFIWLHVPTVDYTVKAASEEVATRIGILFPPGSGTNHATMSLTIQVFKKPTKKQLTNY